MNKTRDVIRPSGKMVPVYTSIKQKLQENKGEGGIEKTMIFINHGVEIRSRNERRLV